MPEEPSLLSSLLAAVQWSPLHLLMGVVIAERITLLIRSTRNTRAARARGAVEFGADHYPAIVAMHVLWCVTMIVEVVLLTRAINPFWPALLAIAIAAMGLRYWCMRVLGSRWSIRILVVPGDKAVHRGPYKWLRHPVYLAVGLELAVIPVIVGAYLTAITATLIHLLLMRIHIRAEENALRRAGKGYDRVGAR